MLIAREKPFAPSSVIVDRHILQCSDRVSLHATLESEKLRHSEIEASMREVWLPDMCASSRHWLPGSCRFESGVRGEKQEFGIAP